MPSMNEGDIDQALELVNAAPEYRRYVEYLSDWRYVLNANSDGWCYWRIGSRCSEKLQKLTEELIEWIRTGGDHPHRLPQPAKPNHKAFLASLTPIKSFATRHKLTAPTLKEEVPKA